MTMKKMRSSALLILVFISFGFSSCGQEPELTDTTSTIINLNETKKDMTNWKKLTDEENRVIVGKGTEYAFSGEYVDNHKEGVYNCKRCNTPLFNSSAKFESRSGWPSFDSMIENNVKEIPDADGSRVEIVCGTCDGHLGHVFKGEGFTDNMTRHCVNSISLNFEEVNATLDTLLEAVEMDTAIFASGCFWGTEYFFEKADGVISTQVGYIGGQKDEPTYGEVCTGTTGHAEAVRVVYDPSKTDFETLAKLFFETHDPSQMNRQGPDVGTQYRTELFYLDDSQKEIAENLVKILEDKGISVATKITKATTFWEGEDYHENYYTKKGGTPYCHGYTKRF